MLKLESTRFVDTFHPCLAQTYVLWTFYVMKQRSVKGTGTHAFIKEQPDVKSEICSYIDDSRTFTFSNKRYCYIFCLKS